MTSADLVYLGLLARDAPSAEYDEPVRRARTESRDPEQAAAVEQARTLALRIRTTLREQRRRENELTALFETAGDLAGLRDLDDVLRAIVIRARKLLGTDVAYLSLHDEHAGDTYMRVTAGSVSAEFQRVRLGMGEGLGGLVAQTSSPYATADYFNDDRFRHTRAIDSAVHDEGLVAILGVPLLVNGKVIGVLFASDRSVRPFTRDELALLGSLATHAAIAIESANQLAETKAALAELAEASRVIREHSAAVERAAEAHEALTGLLLRGAGVGELAASVSDLLGGTVCLTDDQGRVLHGAEADARGPGVQAAAAQSERTGRAVLAAGRWVAAIQAGGERLGTLAFRGPADLDKAEQRILERAAMVTALRLLTERSVREAEYQVRGELLTDLLDAVGRADPDAAGLRERARRLSADLDAAHVLVVARAEDADRRRLVSAASHLAATRHGLAGERAGTIVLLLPGTEPTATARDVVHHLHAAIQRPVTAGAAGPAFGPLAVAALFEEAERCLGALLALGRIGDGACAADLGFVGLLLGGGRVPGFVEAVLGPVLEYDARRQTDLLRTLEAYFACGGNLMRAKDRLHVHVNTVTQRLERIGKLLGADWQAPDRALELQLALRLHRLR
ncbi:helix-turn-helix domain-containing protein [Actinospica durhamensis]|uniref:Helix-turn-helix domain-containing protein n=1 Tax=Actinospica durhamensis TaxID=1508375 RepID=A0A941ITC3_9ACTN|nr:GAF domain-containing protein [Actinospica durhamensis]MBR7834206.1 helix-turn-helix domain-containing protein [Actinospica durhamensis]